jgi:tetratricopeptide (TPR) repeat protein
MSSKPLLHLLLATGFLAVARHGAALEKADVSVGTDALRYAGSQSCRECHERFYGLWSTSHHGLAMQPFNAELGRTKLTPQKAPISVGPLEFRADPIKGTVTENGPAGEQTYPIVHAMGGKNVFYFLTPLERGRLQVLPVAYDVNRLEWFDTAASAMRHFGNTVDAPLFWKEAPYTFNTACFNCHVSQMAKNYDPATDSYGTKWGEPGINCETCHGPAGEHVRAARLIPPGQPMPYVKLIVTRTMTTEQTNAMCGSCHAKLSPLTDSFTPGDRFFDHFATTTLEDPDFYPDGRDLGENFTMTTWGLSPCARSGRLDCVDCHTSSGRYKFREGNPNAVCLPCHQERVKSVAAHSHHPEASAGARCVACHMPMTEFARMRRSDHSMRPPTPAATLAFKSPNACNLCHEDKDATWAGHQVRAWHQDDYQAPVLQRAGWVAAARASDWTKLPEIVKYLVDPAREEIWAASLVRLLRNCDDATKWTGIRACLQDKSPLVRAAAVEALGDSVKPDTLPLLLAAIHDDYRLVRVRAAAALAPVARESLGTEDRRALEAATGEYLASLRVRPDDPVSHYNLGNFHMERQSFREAIAEFTTAHRFQPQSLPPLANRALAYAAIGENDQAEASLRQALAIDPGNPAVNLNLGMLLAELGRRADAEQAFRTAFKSDPRAPAAAYNLGVLLAADRPQEALEWCRKAVTLRPHEARYAYTLAFFLNQQGQTKEAVSILEAAIVESPASGEAYALLGAIYERQGKPAEAAAVYRSAVTNPRLSDDERRQFQASARSP